MGFPVLSPNPIGKQPKTEHGMINALYNTYFMVLKNFTPFFYLSTTQ